MRKLDISFKNPKKAAHPVVFVDGATSSVDRTGKKTLYVAGGELAKIEYIGFLRLLRRVMRDANANKLGEVSVRVKDLKKIAGSDSIPTVISDFDLGLLVAENFVMGQYEFTPYKTAKSEAPSQVGRVYIPDASKEFIRGAKKGLVIGSKANLARTWSNTTAKDLTPAVLADLARAELEQYESVSIRILDEIAIEQEGLGLVLGVGKGAANPPRFIVAEYRGGDEGDSWVALVGKGVTYDTGGLSLKPSEGMLDMHLDKSGGTGVLAALSAMAALKIRKNIVAIVPAVENAISAEAQRPGDIVTSYLGKNVEVQNTDAEGRLILGDGIAYAEKNYKPLYIFEASTLTGASLIAVGQCFSGLFTKDDDLANDLIEIGESCDELLWRLPVNKFFADQIKENTRADLKNIVSHGHKWGGASTGAAFVHEFVSDKTTLVHLDIAPRMESIKGDQLADRATGVPVRLLVRAVEQLG